MDQEKIDAARKTIETLETPLDLDLWADEHPGEDRGLDRLAEDLEDPERWDGMA